MRIQRLVFAVLLFTLIVFAFQAPQPTPLSQHEPDGNPQHDGQPEFCQSDHRNNHAPNCECRAMEKAHCPGPDNDCGDGLEPDEPTGRESSKCKVYCRKNMCFCASPCNG